MRRLVYLAMLAATLVPAINASAESPGEKRVAQQIGSHLKQSGQLHNYRVGVKFHEGTAYLAGGVANQEQRDTAVRLAQQVEGVSHVVCKLEIENQGQATAQNTEPNSGEEDRQQLSNELDRASYEGAQNDSASVMQAYGQGGEQQAAPIQQYQQFQQNQMAQRQQMGMGRPYAQPARRSNMPVPAGRFGGAPMGPNPMMGQNQMGPSGVNQASCSCNGGGGAMGIGGPGGMGGGPPAGFVPGGGPGGSPNYDNPQMPGYAWPSYASQQNYAAVSYPQQYSPTAWPYIGPFYPYPQVPLAWRKVSLEWDDGWWFLDFSAHNSSH